MQETELKFQVPEGSRAAVRKAVETATAERTRLQALYVDTAERHLARAGIALRLRKEGRRWVQTLKAGGAHAVQRFEHNVMLPVQSGEPAVDLQRHAGTPGAALLAKALDGAEPAEGQDTLLQVRYRTDVLRLHRVVRVPGGAVELAYDTGWVIAGDRKLALAELELELVRGEPGVLFALARRWVPRHGLWLDVRTKAERGDRLARGDGTSPPVKAGRSSLTRDATPPDAWRCALLDPLAQVLPNASQIAAGGDVPEHLHQLRVGLRRLRSLLRFAEGWGPALPDERIDALRELFGQLGGARDRDALTETLLPRLIAAGAPRVELPLGPVESVPPGVHLRAPATTLLWLDLLERSLGTRGTPVDAAPPPAPVNEASEPAAEALAAAPPASQASAPVAPTAADLRRAVRDRLDRWHRRLRREQKAFAGYDDEARHALRKRLKRLRYAAEFVAPLFAPKAVARYLDAMKPLQESLGSFNDLCVAGAAYRTLLPEDPQAWFVLGWIAARREIVLGECARELKQLTQAEPFWRGRRG